MMPTGSNGSGSEELGRERDDGFRKVRLDLIKRFINKTNRK